VSSRVEDVVTFLADPPDVFALYEVEGGSCSTRSRR
jgi:hypothetical protein